MNNYYEILEISPNASDEVIEKAYKTLAKRYHPDSWPEDQKHFAESRFKEITEAYTVLSNEFERKHYDERIGVNVSYDQKYNELYNEHEKLKQEVNNIKINNESEKYMREQDINRFIKPNISTAKSYLGDIKEAIKNEAQKPKEEKSKDLKAMLLTVVIVAILLFVFWKIPFIRNYLFP